MTQTFRLPWAHSTENTQGSIGYIPPALYSHIDFRVYTRCKRVSNALLELGLFSAIWLTRLRWRKRRTEELYGGWRYPSQVHATAKERESARDRRRTAWDDRIHVLLIMLDSPTKFLLGVHLYPSLGPAPAHLPAIVSFSILWNDVYRSFRCCCHRPTWWSWRVLSGSFDVRCLHYVYYPSWIGM